MKLKGVEVVEQRRDEVKQRVKAERKRENDVLLERLRVALINGGKRGQVL